MESQLPPQPTPEAPVAVAPVPEASAAPVISPLRAEVANSQGITGFTSGMEGGQGDGTGAIEVASPVENEVNKYMAIAKEALSLPIGPDREAKMLEFMGKIEEAKTNGKMEVSIIGEGRDRAVILQKPEIVVVAEPASLSDPGEKPQRFGDMTTISERYLAANRKGFTGFAVITDQSVKIDPSAEAFSAGGAYDKEIFEREFGTWLKDCQSYVRRASFGVQGKVSDLIKMKNYPDKPDSKDYKLWDQKGREDYDRAYEAYRQSDSIRPDGMWAGFIQADDRLMDMRVTRAPGYERPWFDGIQQNPTHFNVGKSETVEAVLKANIKGPKPQQPVVSRPAS